LDIQLEHDMRIPSGRILSAIIYCSLSALVSAQQPRPQFERVEFVFIPGGTFEMGDVWGDSYSEDERPAHPVTVTSFWMSQCEITNAQFCEFLNETGNRFESGATWLDLTDKDCLIVKRGGKYLPKRGFAEHPVVEVTWYGAMAYARWLGGRLPTEAEWEYAARGGGRPIRFPNGEVLTHTSANFSGAGARDRWAKTGPIAMFPPNRFGLYDMAGNVWERCFDWYDRQYYSSSGLNDPTGPPDGTHRVIRGGSWDYSRWHCTTTVRGMNAPDDSVGDIGFRIVKMIEAGE
jgi:formylglycine-generating enzyme required for sulfatase activity